MILDFKPEHIQQLRSEQINMLNWLESNWNRYRVFVINSPTAIGKSIMAMTLANWQSSLNKSTAILTATKMLQDQYTDEFVNVPSLKGKSSYMCSQFEGMSCMDVFAAGESYCDRECKYACTRRNAKESKVAIFNYYSYIFNKFAKDIIIVDEAHKLNSALCDMSSLKLWKHKENYSDNTHTYGHLIMFLTNKIKGIRKKAKAAKRNEDNIKAIQLYAKANRWETVLYDLERNEKEFFIKQKMDYYRGVLKECIEIKPYTTKMFKSKVWSKSTNKIVLMSATVTMKDAEALGLGSYSIGYYECESPIPVSNRKFVVIPAINTSYKNQNQDMFRRLAGEIMKLCSDHGDEKGLIHLTYGFSDQLKKHLTSDRFVWYDKDSKNEMYRNFKKMEGNKVLLGCGLSEGIDLKYDEARFQIITKVMYPSLADEYNKIILEKSAENYSWDTLRTILQQTGRIVRSIDDFGTTYMIDSTFIWLYKKWNHLLPTWFKRAIEWRQST